MSNVVALIMAAGIGQRTGLDVPKQYAKLAGKPLLAHTVDRFLSHPKIDAVRVVIAPDMRNIASEMLAGRDCGSLIDGGARRQQSVLAGLRALKKEFSGSADPVVLIHDAARPFIAPETLTDLLSALGEADGAVAGKPATDSTHQMDAAGTLLRPLPRESIWLAETPQAFYLSRILAAHEAEIAGAHTDDAGLAAAAGLTVKTIRSHGENTKITEPPDLAAAEARLGDRTSAMHTRIGQGFDVHRLQNGDGMMLCGVPILGRLSLKGHSDADVALHAITDALLSAIGADDIGQHFPPSDDRWKDAPSHLFVQHALEMLADKGAELRHAGLILMGEKPRISPHRAAMKKSLQTMLKLPADAVNVAATTTEKLGFLGRSEGLAAMATVTVAVPA